LKSLVREGKFRQDLFYRLEGMTIHLPPLRERRQDIEPLARRFLAGVFGGVRSPPLLHPQALERLKGCAWPGNLRQLQKVLCRAAGVCRGSQIMPEDLDFGELESGPPPAVAAGNTAEAHAALRSLIAWAWQHYPSDLWPLLQQQLEREVLRYALGQPGLSQ